MKFLKRIDSASASSFSLSRVNYLPGLIVFLFHPVLALPKIRYGRNQEGQGSEIFQDFQKCPPAPEMPTRLRSRLASASPTLVRRGELTIRTLLVPAGGAKARAVFDVLKLPCSILVVH